MSDAFYGEFSTDLTAPAVVAVDPPNGAIDISALTTITCDILDTETGVDTVSINVVVDSVPAVVDGVVVAPFDGVGSGVDDLGGGLIRVTLVPTSLLANPALIAVDVDAQDLAPIPNVMTTYSWSFTTEEYDSDPPYVTDPFPAPGSIDVSMFTDISLLLKDDSSGVNRDSICIDVWDGDSWLPAIVDAVFQTGFSGTILPATDAELVYTILIDPDDPLPEFTLITVRVNAKDMVDNVMSPYTWDFTTRVNPGPVFTDFWPTGTDVDTDTEISFQVTDPDGVEHIYARLDGQLMIDDGAAAPGFDVTLTPIVNGFDVLIQPQSLLLLDTEFEITADARDGYGKFSSVTWSFTTRQGLIVSPVLTARGGDARVHLSWTLPPPTEMLQTLYQLRRSHVTYPLTPEDGVLVYEGLAHAFLDTGVINDVTYYYTIFVVRRYVDGVPEYVPYAPEASASARPRQIVSAQVPTLEYVPTRGEFGTRTFNPLPQGQTVAIWGTMSDGRRRESDLIRTVAGKPVQSPARGFVRSITDAGNFQAIEIETKSGIVLVLSGVLLLSSVIAGASLEAGQGVGRTVDGLVEFEVYKLPITDFGRRTIRPRYFYLTVEERDGRR